MTDKLIYRTFKTQVASDKGLIRNESFNGEDHIVVPMVLLVEGVLQGMTSPHPELALAEEFGKFPAGWNGRPLTFGHPKINGDPVSANSPGVLEDNAMGHIFNARIDDGKLKGEAWFNQDLVDNLSEEAQETLKSLQEDDEPLEVSTGLFAVVEEKEGSFEGEKFNGVWTNVVPDHLAILPLGTKGACSVEDGCGVPRLNQDGTPMDPKTLCTCEDKTNCSCGGAQPEDIPLSQEDSSGPFKNLTDKLKASVRSFVGIFDNTSSDVDVRRALALALEAENTETFTYTNVIAVFSDEFIYEEDFRRLLRRSFDISDSEVVTLGSGKTEVRPVTEFIDVVVQTEDDDMNVNELIASESSQWAEEDRAFLEGLDETQLARIVANSSLTEPKLLNDGEPAPAAPVPAVAPIVEEPAPVVNASTPEEYISAAPAEMQSVLTQGLKMQRAQRTHLVKALKDNERNQFSEDELNAMSLETLEKMATIAEVPSYEGAAPIGRVLAAEDDDTPSAPLQVFPIKKAG